MNTIEEKFNGMMAPDPLQRQEGGEHYKGMTIQPVEFVHANNIPYLEGCAIKYLCRHKAKGGVVDLLKAKHYIDLIISLEYKNQQPWQKQTTQYLALRKYLQMMEYLITHLLKS